VVVDGLGRADADWRAGAAVVEDDDDAETLRRRLRDTVETCQRLAAALDARHGGSTTHDVGQTPASTRTCPLLAAVDTVRCVVLPFLGRIAVLGPTFVDAAAYCYRPSAVVCWPVCLSFGLTKS